jgi:hypothetical protein
MLPYYPPEHFDSSFVRVHGALTMKKTAQLVTENVLDMLHISYVHSFGNRHSPLPYNVTYHPTEDRRSGRSHFVYKPNSWTISGKVGDVQEVYVDNEYHLPSTTITRVRAGPITKTVLTRATPVTSDTTRLFWTVYRNFWKVDTCPLLTWLGNRLMTYLMERTLQEDVHILRHVYDEDTSTNPRRNVITPFDVTIQQYRRALHQYLLLPPHSSIHDHSKTTRCEKENI